MGIILLISLVIILLGWFQKATGLFFFFNDADLWSRIQIADMGVLWIYLLYATWGISSVISGMFIILIGITIWAVVENGIDLDKI